MFLGKCQERFYTHQLAKFVGRVTGQATLGYVPPAALRDIVVQDARRQIGQATGVYAANSTISSPMLSIHMLKDL